MQKWNFDGNPKRMDVENVFQVEFSKSKKIKKTKQKKRSSRSQTEENESSFPILGVPLGLDR
jgi:hypothetical protein